MGQAPAAPVACGPLHPVLGLNGAGLVEIEAAHNGWMVKPEWWDEALDQAVATGAAQHLDAT